jgi:hypothetical protein
MQNEIYTALTQNIKNSRYANRNDASFEPEPFLIIPQQDYDYKINTDSYISISSPKELLIAIKFYKIDKRRVKTFVEQMKKRINSDLFYKETFLFLQTFINNQDTFIDEHQKIKDIIDTFFKNVDIAHFYNLIKSLVQINIFQYYNSFDSFKSASLNLKICRQRVGLDIYEQIAYMILNKTSNRFINKDKLFYNTMVSLYLLLEIDVVKKYENMTII